MFRFVFLNAFILLYSVLICVWGLFVSWITGSERQVHFRAAVPWARGILRYCGIHVRATGLGNVDPSLPRIYMSNHQSYFDILALLAFLPVDFKFIVKQELMRIPLLGSTMRAVGYMGIERDDPRKAIRSIARATARISGGTSVLIFPEGTRSLDGRLQGFKMGGFRLALKSGCGIVPITIVDSHRIVPKGSLNIRKGSFSLHVGRPIPVQGLKRRDTKALMEQVHSAMLAPLKNPDAPQGESPAPGPRV